MSGGGGEPHPHHDAARADLADPSLLAAPAARDPDLVLTDYDTALACANTRDGFDEIEAEFAPQLETLAREPRALAHRIRQRHLARLTAPRTPSHKDPQP